jgi:glycerol-3-phosphate dehydrogenase
MPFYRAGRLPPWKGRLGMTLYDLLAGRENIQRSRPIDVRHLMKECPALKSTGLRGGAAFFDAQMDDARLCIEVLLTAAAHGARLANYVEAIALEQQSSATSVRVLDHVSGKERTIRARLVLNATGPWVDQLCRLAGDESGPYLQPTKGVHVVVADQGLQAGFLLLHPADGRVFFVLPWLGKTLIGTSDTFTPAGPDALTVEPEEIAYLLEGFNHHFAPLLRVENVLGSFAGLRPLLRDGAGKPSSLSREFRVWQGPLGLLSVAGGKYTTFRHMAEVVTNRIGQVLGKRQRCRTSDFPLIGTPDVPWAEYLPGLMATLCQQFALSETAATHLANRYGRRALDVAAYLDKAAGNREPLCPGEPDLRAEIDFQRDHEMALFEADHWLRRTRLGLLGKKPWPIDRR